MDSKWSGLCLSFWWFCFFSAQLNKSPFVAHHSTKIKFKRQFLFIHWVVDCEYVFFYYSRHTHSHRATIANEPYGTQPQNRNKLSQSTFNIQIRREWQQKKKVATITLISTTKYRLDWLTTIETIMKIWLHSRLNPKFYSYHKNVKNCYHFGVVVCLFAPNEYRHIYSFISVRA